MARIYSSRTLLDPAALQSLSRESESRLNRDIERRRNVLGATQTLLGDTGKTLDEYLQKKRTDEDYRKRYQDVAWQSSAEQMRDPLFRAALDEYARTGSAGPLSNYQLARETSEANKLERARAEAEKRELASRAFELEKAEQLPQFKEAMRMYNEEMAKPVPNYELADEYLSRADAINKKFGFDARELAKIGEANRRTAEARAEAAKVAREEQELEEMGARNLKKLQDAEEVDRQYRVAEFLAALPSTYKDDAAKQAVIRQIADNPDMTKEEKTAELKRLVSVDTGADAVRKAIQNAIANAAAQNTAESIKEQKELKAILEKQQRNVPLSSREQALVNKYSQQAPVTPKPSTPNPKPSTPKPAPTPKPNNSSELARIMDKKSRGIPLSSRERQILDEAGVK